LKNSGQVYNLLSKWSGILDACNTVDEVSSAINDAIHYIWPQSSGALFLLEEDNKLFHKAKTWGSDQSNESINPDACWSYRLGRVFPDDLETNLRCQVEDCNSLNSRLCVPVFGGGKIQALLRFGDYIEPENAMDSAAFSLLIERAGLAIYNIKLQESLKYKSTRDSLTGLFNRRYLDETLELAIKHSIRTKEPLCIVVFDIDHFRGLLKMRPFLDDKPLMQFARGTHAARIF